MFSQIVITNPKTCTSNYTRGIIDSKKLLFAVGQMKPKSAFQNTPYEEAWHTEGLSLFYSLIV